MQANKLSNYSSRKSYLGIHHMDMHVTILAVKGHRALLLYQVELYLTHAQEVPKPLTLSG